MHRCLGRYSSVVARGLSMAADVHLDCVTVAVCRVYNPET